VSGRGCRSEALACQIDERRHEEQEHAQQQCEAEGMSRVAVRPDPLGQKADHEARSGAGQRATSRHHLHRSPTYQSPARSTAGASAGTEATTKAASLRSQLASPRRPASSACTAQSKARKASSYAAKRFASMLADYPGATRTNHGEDGLREAGEHGRPRPAIHRQGRPARVGRRDPQADLASCNAREQAARCARGR